MKKIKFVSILMTLVMMITFTPFSLLQAMAEGIKEIDIDISELTTEKIEPVAEPLNEQGIVADNYIEKEFVEKRTANSKQFLMDDGMIMVQNYGVPIHYEEDGVYKEIDNSLIQKTEITGKQYFENAANSFKARLYDNLGQENSVSIENNGFELSFTLDKRNDEEAKSSKGDLIKSAILNDEFAKVNKIANSDAVDYTDKQLKIPIQPNVSDSTLRYEDVYSDIDFEYSVNSVGIKEDIIVNRPLNDYQFSFTITAPELLLVLSDTGEIIAYSESEAVFAIPAPNMTDANGVYSEEVYYTLVDNEDGTYSLGIRPDNDWMNAKERSFPVRIDPAVYSIEKQTANGLTLYYSSGGDPEYNASRIKFGKVNSAMCDSFMSFPNENDQFYFSGYQLAYSKLRYYIRSVGSNAAGETTYYVRTAKTNKPLSSITSFSDINYSGTPILLDGSIESTKFLFFNASHDARWEEVYFNPESFNGCADMVFMWYYRDTNDNQHGEVDVRSGNLPSVLNYYVSTVGIKESLPYEQFDYNGGTANVNLINGALTASFTALSIDTPENPISIELVYNDYYDEIMDEFGMHNMFGNNIKLNFQQSKLYDDRAVRYIDADGSIDTLCQSIGSGNPVHYSVDNSLTFYSSDNALYINGNTKLLFDGNKSYRFYDASFIHQEKLMYDIIYSGNKITQIDGYTDGSRSHYVKFTYSGDYVSSAQSYIATSLGSTSFQALAKCDFTYDEEGNLIQIKNSNSGNSKYTLEYYNGELYGVTDFDGNGYIFGRAHWTNSSPMRMSIINYIYGNSPEFDDYYSYDYVYFSGDETTSNVTYYSVGGSYVGERNVSRRFTQGAQSEWYEDADGEITITAATSSMTGETSQESVTYTQNIYSTTEKQNTSLSGNSYNSIAPGGSITGSILSNHGIVSKTGRQYAVSMLIETSGTAYVEVLIGGTSRAKLSLNGKNYSYFIIPTSYHSTSSTTSIQIKNVGSNYVYVSNVSYNYYTSTKITKRMQTMTIQNYVSSIENRGLDYKQTTNYDFLGQATSGTEVDYTGSSSVTKNYTYTYEAYPNVSPASEFDLKRLKSISNGTDEVVYSYSGNVTTMTTKKNGTNVSQIITETGGALGSHYTIRTENGITTRIDYGIKGGNVRPYKVTTGNQSVEYSYNYDGEIKSISYGSLTQNITYGNGKETGYNLSGGSAYTLTRSEENFGLVTGITHNGSQRLSMTYTSYGDIDLTTYANGATIDYIYDYRDLTSVELKDSSSAIPTVINYGYDGNKLTSVSQSYDGNTQLSYLFDNTSTQSSTNISGDVNASYVYNYDAEKGWLTSSVVNLENGACTRTDNYVYDNHGMLQENGNSSYKTQYTYDSFDRLSTKKQLVNGTVQQNIQYGYDNTSNYQSGRVKTIYNSTTGYTQRYEYHSNGYISQYTNPQNGDNYTYTYDGAGRLINDGVYTYSYDTCNNIISKTGAGKTYTYTYWPGTTRIKSIIENGVESEQFIYDTTGNILYYRSSTQNLYWTRGNMLSHGTVQTGKPFTYKYDADNLRYSKTVNGTETIYYWDCGVLLGEKTGSNYTQYLYDASGIIGMIYNGSYYYFEKNLFGDVLRVYNSSGTTVASFTYDSYGNVLSQTGSMMDKVHFRYRGYYYDSETGFYYLQTRYYDPSICRFISADQLELLGTLADYPGQINLYAYCNNNPIMYTDPTGEIFGWIIVLIGVSVGATIGGIVGGITAANNGADAWGVVGGVLLGGVIGAAGGALLTAGGAAAYAGVASIIPSLTVDLVLIKETVALGLAVHNIIAVIAGPLLGVDWQLVEWGESSPDVLPNRTPYSNISGMKSNNIGRRNTTGNTYINKGAGYVGFSL